MIYTAKDVGIISRLKAELQKERKKLEIAVEGLEFYKDFDCNVLTSANSKSEVMNIYTEFWTKDNGVKAKEVLEKIKNMESS